jgi:hypothetical protein
MIMMMNGAQIVSEAKHRMHVAKYIPCNPWTIEIRGYIATICPSDNNVKWVYYRHHWFEVVIDELITSFRDSQGKLDERFDIAMREAIEKCINENHITFNEGKN